MGESTLATVERKIKENVEMQIQIEQDSFFSHL